MEFQKLRDGFGSYTGCMLRYLPLFIAAAFAGVMIGAKLLTNHHLRKHRAEITNAPITGGQIPNWISAIYLFGLLGLVGTGVWAFVWISWWAAGIVVGLYFVTGLVRSELYSEKR
jgi:hypothetical protein